MRRLQSEEFYLIKPAAGIEFIWPNERKVFSKVGSIEFIYVTTTGNCDYYLPGFQPF